MTQAKKSLGSDTRGAASIEYLIIAGLVALLCIGAWRTFGTNMQTRITTEAVQINTIP
jgi:Flp pilus assembly pilin Flp